MNNTTDTILVEYDASNLITNLVSLSEARSPILGTPAKGAATIYSSVRGRLHNLSVQVECLGTSGGLVPSGSVYVGSVPTLEGSTTAGLGSATLKQAWAEDSIAVGYIRSHSAASLTQKSAVVHSNISENVAFKQWHDFIVPTSATEVGGHRVLNGLEPIVVYVPKVANPSHFRINVGHQWCTRHPNDPAMRATQQIHLPTATAVWNTASSMLRTAGSAFASAAAAPLGAAAGRRLVAEYGPAAALA